MRRANVAAVLLACSAMQGVAQVPRQLDAHRHGHGTLNLALEGQTLTMELEVPGADVVGFEHTAKTAADKAKVEAAKKVLAQPLTLFVVHDKAGCKVASARVSLAGEMRPEQRAQRHRRDDKHGAQDDYAAHSAFRAEYVLTCSNVAAIDTIQFPYFHAFPKSEELAVTLITGKGQKAFEVNREHALIDIRGMI